MCIEYAWTLYTNVNRYQALRAKHVRDSEMGEGGQIVTFVSVMLIKANPAIGLELVNL